MLNKRIDMDEDLRDFFAAFAMNSLLQKFKEFDMSLDKIRIADGSYEMADAMLEARKQENEDVKCK